MNVFVYGTLKKGHWNSVILRDSELLFKATTVSNKYDMVDLGSFPAIIKGGGFRITGEVYNVNKRTLQQLDALEGNGSFYNREKILVEPLSAMDKMSAWTYILDSNKAVLFNPAYKSGSMSLRYNNDTVSWDMGAGLDEL